ALSRTCHVVRPSGRTHPGPAARTFPPRGFRTGTGCFRRARGCPADQDPADRAGRGTVGRLARSRALPVLVERDQGSGDGALRRHRPGGDQTRGGGLRVGRQRLRHGTGGDRLDHGFSYGRLVGGDGDTHGTHFVADPLPLARHPRRLRGDGARGVEDLHLEHPEGPRLKEASGQRDTEVYPPGNPETGPKLQWVRREWGAGCLNRTTYRSVRSPRGPGRPCEPSVTTARSARWSPRPVLGADFVFTPRRTWTGRPSSSGGNRWGSAWRRRVNRWRGSTDR